MGFKWFVPGLFDGSCCFGGEESAGASVLRHDGTVCFRGTAHPDVLLSQAQALVDAAVSDHP